jgi:hypothetical protein
MFRTAAIVTMIACPVAAQVDMDASRIDCEVIYTVISETALLSDAAQIGLDALLEGASTATAVPKAELTAALADLCRNDPNLSLGTAIRILATQ